MNDANGQGLVVQTWRSSYDVGEYQLERPLVMGFLDAAEPVRVPAPQGHLRQSPSLAGVCLCDRASSGRLTDSD